MPRSLRLQLSQIADWGNVNAAAYRACRGKGQSEAVRQWRTAPQANIRRVCEALSASEMPVGRFHGFRIHDPKARLIHAAPLADRVAHHALMAHAEPAFERVLLPCVYACRVGKGVHRAVVHAQALLRRSPWVMHLDIRHYFPAIDHTVLRGQLARRFCGDGLALFDAVIDSFSSGPGKGLPIGALSSQHLANHYLNDADRWCLAQSECRGLVRYMDDYLIVGDSCEAMLTLRDRLQQYLASELQLECKPVLLQRSSVGVTFCGVKLKPFQLSPSARRKRRYRQRLAYWERRYLAGEIDAGELQRAADAVQAIVLPSTYPPHAWEGIDV